MAYQESGHGTEKSWAGVLCEPHNRPAILSEVYHIAQVLHLTNLYIQSKMITPNRKSSHDFIIRCCRRIRIVRRVATYVLPIEMRNKYHNPGLAITRAMTVKKRWRWTNAIFGGNSVVFNVQTNQPCTGTNVTCFLSNRGVVDQRILNTLRCHFSYVDKGWEKKVAHIRLLQ